MVSWFFVLLRVWKVKFIGYGGSGVGFGFLGCVWGGKKVSLCWVGVVFCFFWVILGLCGGCSLEVIR